MIRQIGLILRKELTIEWRQRSRASGLLFFAFILVLMIAFSSPSQGVLQKMAGGTLWIGVLLASTRALDQSFSVELENGTLDGQLLWPVDGRAIYYGKALANFAMLFSVAAALTPMIFALYSVEFRGSLGELGALLFLGSASIAAPGTLYGAMSAHARGSSVLLPLLLFPLVVPAVLAAARGTTLVIQGDPMEQVPSWIGLLAGFNAMHWSLSGVFFSRILEDG